MTVNNFIDKEIAAWEVKYGQIKFSGAENVLARELFSPYFGNTFKLETFEGTFDALHFNEKGSSTSLRLSCSEFFKRLRSGETIYFSPKDYESIEVTRFRPTPDSRSAENIGRRLSETELLETIAALTKENMQLRETNSSLFLLKEQLDKYQSLQKIFNDERFLEDWLERNIHTAIADLEIIDRQPTIPWPKSGLKNRLDFFCVDRTTRELVIVENKVRGNKTTIQTQYLTYKAWVSENLDAINQKYHPKNILATRNFKFVIITDSNDERLESMCRHAQITLVLIDGGVVFELLGYPYGE